MSDNSQAESYFLGIDGGGSKTLALIVDAQGRECGRGTAGSSNYAAIGLEQAVHHIYQAAENAVLAAACQLPVRAAWLGLAGIDRPQDCDTLLPHLYSLAHTIRLTNDGALLLSALPDAAGVALIAGTGSIAIGCDRHGIMKRAGGWGHVLGDEGSGYALGRLGLQAAVRSADRRGPATDILERVMQAWQLTNADEILACIYPEDDKATVAQVAPLVLAAARAGDRVARKIVNQGAEELACAALAVYTALDFVETRMPLALGGGLLVHEVAYRQQVIRRIRRHYPVNPAVIVENPALSAARAALYLSKEVVG